MKTTLHHFAYNIQPNTLENCLELFDLLGCTIAYQVEGARWCQIEQKPIPVDIQIIEVNENPVDIKKKTNTHIAFLSDDPHGDILVIKKWAENKKINFRDGGWSDRELWFDLPDIFTNFVVEIMHTSIVE